MTGSRGGSPKAGGETATAEARKRWEQAAFRAGMLFILFPVILIPFPLAMTRHWVPHSLILTFATVIGWIALVCCSVAYGWFRIRKYKRDHPFVE